MDDTKKTILDWSWLDSVMEDIYLTIAPNPEELAQADPTFAQELGFAFEEAKQTIRNTVEKQVKETKT